MQKWEYLSIRQQSSVIGSGIFVKYPNGDEKKISSDADWKIIHGLLNQFGEIGYELLDTSTSATNAGIYNRTWVLKRPKS
jgi:predicted ATPase